MVYAVLADNKLRETLFDAYMTAVRKWGQPLEIRSDKAAEHRFIKDKILAWRRHAVKKPWRTGSSTHNQVRCLP